MFKQASKQFRQAFTLIELLVVVAIIGILMSLIMVVSPNSSDKQTMARMQLLSSAISAYHRSFYLYPSFKDSFYDSTGDGISNSGAQTLVEVLTARDIRRRDGKHVAQMHTFTDEDAETEMDTVDNKQYLLDGWGNRLLYYSGLDIEHASPADINIAIGHWCIATGVVPIGTPNIANIGRQRKPSHWYFLMSAGEDEEFYYNVVASGGGSSLPSDYNFTDVPDQYPDTVNSNVEEYDDFSNHNLGQR